MRLAVRLKALPQVVSSASFTSSSVRERFRPPRPVSSASRSLHRSARLAVRPSGDTRPRARPPRGGVARAPSSRREAPRANPMAATKANARTSRSSTEPDIEDLFAKHPGVRSVIDSAPDMSRRLLEWYDKRHRVLPWRRNAFSKHCLPTDVVLSEDKDIIADDASNTRDNNSNSSKSKADALQYWRLDVCETKGASKNVPQEQYAYGVWVSEIMSQQTQIERVATYWRRWMAKWPTVSALADATQEEVNEMWAGLGYYRRARFLLEGAKHVTNVSSSPKNDAGKEGDEDSFAKSPPRVTTNFPRTSKALSAVPGVGPYTAAAVASIAFGESVAAVDGNVIRVATRLACARGGGDATKNGTSAARAVRTVADSLISFSSERPGDFNQAMMELGATVCLPRNPKCSECPVADKCQGLAAQKAAAEENADHADHVKFSVTDLPEKEKKAPKREESVAVRFVEARVFVTGDPDRSETGYLLTKRPEGGLLGGLWEFPSVAVPQETAENVAENLSVQNLEASAARVVRSLRVFENLPFGENTTVDFSTADTYVGAVTHVFSHVRQTMHVTKNTVFVALPFGSEIDDFFANAGSSDAGVDGAGTEWRWVREKDVKGAGLSSGVVKVHALVTSPPKMKPPKKEKQKSETVIKVAPGNTAIGKMFDAAKKRKTTEP